MTYLKRYTYDIACKINRFITLFIRLNIDVLVGLAKMVTVKQLINHFTYAILRVVLLIKAQQQYCNE